MNNLLNHIQFIWWMMLAGVLSGAAIGLCFHRQEWLGGYNSFQRRLLRLGHISFFGLAFVNGIFVLTITCTSLDPKALAYAGSLLIAGSTLMPLCCFLTAYKINFRYLFPLPTLAITGAILTMLHALN